MKKSYSAPKMEVVELKKENMILTSGECEKYESPVCPDCMDKCRIVCLDTCDQVK